ncbi:hypothetical protein HB912_05290 [Listeria aquatica]|uniref:Uncharacterized protein n=2 Tax=Listeria aquatica TaxID=1494960 RepID=A0A841ZNH0_9LIST|nr:hypothetical protein [Listeria aquatica]
MGIMAQMFSEPEFISISVTFLLTLAIFRFWPAIRFLKPTMTTHVRAIQVFHLPIGKVKINALQPLNFVVNWIVVALKKTQPSDDETHCSSLSSYVN